MCCFLRDNAAKSPRNGLGETMQNQRLLIYGCLLVVSTGCTGTQGETYLGAPGSRAWFATAAPETVAAYFSKRCAAYGFQPGTPAMAQCIQSEAQSRQNQNAIRSAALAQANAQEMATINANRPKQTSCMRNGNFVNCTTY